MGHHHHHTHGTSAPASVVLDLGGSVGALVIYTGPELLGHEIEISPVGPGGAPDAAAVRTHAEVRQRAVKPRPLYGALIPDLAAGRYAVWNRDPPPSIVEVVGGAVTEMFAAESA
jgi:hypothetical protein